MISRRGFLVGSVTLLTAPLATEAQQAGKVPRIGYAVAGLPEECKWTPLDDAFLQGLRDLGYIPERTIILDRRCYTRDDQLPKVMNEFVQLKVDVIVAGPPVIAQAAKNATKDIPIVCASCGDPVDYGLVSSLARPGGNLTGLASFSGELTGKRVALLKEAVPGVSRIAVFIDPDGPGTRTMLRALDKGARALGIETQRIEFRNMADFENAFRSAAAGGAGAVLIQDNPFVFFGRTEIAKLALKHRLPIAAGFRENADAGALMAYGPIRTDLYRRAAGFVDRILKGANPANLPVEQATKFELVINLKTARALGLTIPPSLLLRADQVIE